MSSGLFSRIARAWSVLIGGTNVDCAPPIPHICPTDEIRAIKSRIEKLIFALMLKELPVALIDEINKLSSDIDAALAAKDAAAAQTVADLATANDTIADLNAQIQAATDAVTALETKLAPSPTFDPGPSTATA